MLFEYMAPELYVGFSGGGFDDFCEDRFEFIGPPFQPIFSQPAGLIQHSLPIFRRAEQRDFRNAADGNYGEIFEIGLHGFHCGNLRGDSCDRGCGGKIGGQQVDDIRFEIRAHLVGK